VRLFLPNFTCVTAPYIDKKNATAGQSLAVAESADHRIHCGDILLYGFKDGGIEVFTDAASFAKFLLACESENVLLGFYRHGEIIEISNAVLKQTVIA
ncbi:MAG: hypothetical protein J6V82_03830, partial [Clostridia bacterium]|nr:hypothetical protein [Clostridia bacterium]